LALYTYRALRYYEEYIKKYESKLLSIDPFTTLYVDNTGEGDLNVETASITLLAMYSTLPLDIFAPPVQIIETKPTDFSQMTRLINVAISLIMVVPVLILIMKMLRGVVTWK
jgi:hypothetical protein